MQDLSIKLIIRALLKRTLTIYSHTCAICVSGRVSVWVLEEPVGGGAPVGDVIEEDLQLIVVVKVCNDDSANRGRHGELLGRYVLREAKVW